MTVHVVREGPQPDSPVVEVAVVGLTPDFTVRFIADDLPALYVDAGGVDGVVAGADLPALAVALAQLAATYGHDLAAPDQGA